ncbi:hypothetical protein ACX80W_10685 [Arthrobacter sp. TMN-37]
MSTETSSGTGRAAGRVAARVAGGGFAGVFRIMKILRPVRPIHPHGVRLGGTLTVDGSATSGIPWLDTAGSTPVQARLSRSVGLPGPLPDIVGLAVRIPSGDAVADVLLASTGSSPVGRFLLVPRRDIARSPLTTMMPYRGERGPVLLAARTTGPDAPGGPAVGVPAPGGHASGTRTSGGRAVGPRIPAAGWLVSRRRAGGWAGLRTPARWRPGGRNLRRPVRLPASLPAFRRTLGGGTWTMELCYARPLGPWLPFGTLTLALAPDQDRADLRFDPVLNPLPTAATYGWAAALRRRSYAVARARTRTP